MVYFILELFIFFFGSVSLNRGYRTFIYLSNNKIILNRSQINQLPKITRYRLWRNCFQILGTFDIGFYWIEKCRLYSQLKTTFSFCLINNIELKGIQNQLILSKVKN